MAGFGPVQALVGARDALSTVFRNYGDVCHGVRLALVALRTVRSRPSCRPEQAAQRGCRGGLRPASSRMG